MLPSTTDVMDTLLPRCSSSMRMLSKYPCKACLHAAYGAVFTIPIFPAMLDTQRIVGSGVALASITRTQVTALTLYRVERVGKILIREHIDVEHDAIPFHSRMQIRFTVFILHQRECIPEKSHHMIENQHINCFVVKMLHAQLHETCI
eukprot:m.38313 g.38313  ORF g.38313 m.38313 type:complete len:148 (+) comp14621_c0_seq3:531-974(+)